MNLSGSGVVPTKTMALLVCDAADSPRLPELGPGQSVAPVARLDRTLAEVITAHGGVRLGEHGDRDRFVVAFARVSDAVACAMALQRAPLAPIRLRIAVHTAAVSPAGQGKDPRPAIDRAARLCDVANNGQTLLSQETEQLVAERLPQDAWLTDLGAYVLRGAAYPERVVQLCHRDLVNDFPPLRTNEAVAGDLPLQLTSFVGRAGQLTDLRRLVSDHRLVTVTGPGGVGKTRLALQLAGEMDDEFADGVRWVDLASITDPNLVALRAARTLGLPDQPGRSATDTVARFIGDGRMLMVLDNCEHLRDACASLITTLLSTCAGLRIVATSREPIGVAGEVTWRTPPLSLADEAVELFTQRARLARPEFAVTGDNAASVAQICWRLDGLPLAIELAATRVRTLSLTAIIDGLGQRFALLKDGPRTVTPRQQTLRASVDWSHALLSESQQVVFHRLAVFSGGFDLDAAYAVAGDPDAPRYRFVDELAQLVDKSLVVADHTGDTTRYAMLETLRQYALEKLDESGEADAARTCHRDHYSALVDTSASTGQRWRITQAEIELDNLRAAFVWSRRHGDVELAARLASSLQPLWFRGRMLEGLTWLDDALAYSAALAPATHIHTLADKVSLEALNGDFSHPDLAQRAVAVARDLDDPVLLARALAACGFVFFCSPATALPYLQEAIELTSALGDDGRLTQILGMQAYSSLLAGDLPAMRAATEKGRDLADAVGGRGISRFCGWLLGLTQFLEADLVNAAAQFRKVVGEAQAGHDPLLSAQGLSALSVTLAYQGDISGARTAADASVDAVADLGALQLSFNLGRSALTLLAAGDAPGAVAAADAARDASVLPQVMAIDGDPAARVALASGDVVAARRWADEALSAASGVHRIRVLATHVRVAIAEGDVRQAEQDADDALAITAETKAYLSAPDVVECLATLAAESGSHREAARLLGSAAAIRDRTGVARFKIYDADYAATVDILRETMQHNDFEDSWAEGAALSTAEAVVHARRGFDRPSERKRPSSGWASLTPTERDVVRLVGEGLRNKDIAVRLFVSTRTVETHLTHIYAKLNLSSRVLLVQEAARQT